VIFSDVSSELLDVCRQQAIDRGDLDRCQFIHTGAEDLSMVSSGSLDAVTMRAVLIYVKDKIGSLGEAFRVLRPTGRLVIHEPINRFIVSDTETRFSGYDVTAVSDIAVKIEAFYEMIQDPTDDPMMDFDERDLMDLALQAGFAEVHIEYQADIASHVAPQPWDRFTATAGNPLVPTLGEAIKRCLTDAEAATFSDHLRPLVERGVGIHRMAGVLLWATKE
jgi:ubiquinone/menaquinone biosynthesis C-methylase UbiE